MTNFQITQAPFLTFDHFQAVTAPLEKAHAMLTKEGDTGHLHVHLHGSETGTPIREVIGDFLGLSAYATYDALWVLCSTMRIYDGVPDICEENIRSSIPGEKVYNPSPTSIACRDAYRACVASMREWMPSCQNLKLSP